MLLLFEFFYLTLATVCDNKFDKYFTDSKLIEETYHLGLLRNQCIGCKKPIIIVSNKSKKILKLNRVSFGQSLPSNKNCFFQEAEFVKIECNPKLMVFHTLCLMKAKNHDKFFPENPSTAFVEIIDLLFHQMNDDKCKSEDLSKLFCKIFNKIPDDEFEDILFKITRDLKDLNKMKSFLKPESKKERIVDEILLDFLEFYNMSNFNFYKTLITKTSKIFFRKIFSWSNYSKSK